MKRNVVAKLVKHVVACLAFHLHEADLVSLIREQNEERIKGVNGPAVLVGQRRKPAEEGSPGGIFQIEVGERCHHSEAESSLRGDTPPESLSA